MRFYYWLIFWEGCGIRGGWSGVVFIVDYLRVLELDKFRKELRDFRIFIKFI